jgi:GGDEF domain-containing protein
MMGRERRKTSTEAIAEMFRYLRLGFIGIIASAIGVTVTLLIWSEIIAWPRQVSVILGCATFWFIVAAEYSVRRSEALVMEAIKKMDQSAMNRLDRMARVTESGSSHDYRYLLARVKEEQERVDRHGGVVAMMALRVPSLEAEDEEGQSATNISEDLAEHLSSQLRVFDELRCVRAGEFLAVLPQTNRRDARKVAEGLCRELRGLAPEVCRMKGGPDLTVKVGLATYPLNGETAYDSIAAARRAASRADESSDIVIAVAEEYVTSESDFDGESAEKGQPAETGPDES